MPNCFGILMMLLTMLGGAATIPALIPSDDEPTDVIGYRAWSFVGDRDLEAEFETALFATYPEFTRDADGEEGRVANQTFLLTSDGNTVATFPNIRFRDRDQNRDLKCQFELVETHVVVCSELLETDFPLRRLQAVNVTPLQEQFYFNNDFLIRAEESDLWVFDTTNATFANLTDDGYEGRLFSEEAIDLPQDYAPFAVGDDLYFFRSLRQDDDDFPFTMELYHLEDDENIQLVRDFTNDLPSISIPNQNFIAVSPDQTQLVFLTYPLNRNMIQLWLYDLATDSLERLVDLRDFPQIEWVDYTDIEQPFAPEAITWTPAGILVLGTQPVDGFGGGSRNLALVNPNTRDVSLWIDLNEFEDRLDFFEARGFDSFLPFLMFLSPEGSTVFYGAPHPDTDGLVIYALPSDLSASAVEVGRINQTVFASAPFEERIFERMRPNGTIVIEDVLLVFEAE